MHVRALRQLALAVFLGAGAACGPPIDLAQALEVTEVLTGYYDDGVQLKNLNDGRGPIHVNVIKPSLTFRLKNKTDRELTSVQVMASFWKAGEDGEWDSVLVHAISSDGLAPGAVTNPLTLRPNTSFNVEGARTSLFEDHRFVDITIKLFGKRGGGLYRLGEYKLDRVILPQAGRGASRP